MRYKLPQALKSRKRMYHVMEKYKTVCVVRFELRFQICVRDKQLSTQKGAKVYTDIL